MTTTDGFAQHTITAFENDTGDNSTFPATTQSPWELGYGPIEQYWQFIVAYHLHDKYLYILSAIGVPGNIISIITIANMKPLTPSSLYVMCLAVVDTTALLSNLLLKKFNYYDIFLNDASCKFLWTTLETTMIYANWVLVAMTTERFFAIWFPFKANRYLTKELALVIMATLFAFSCGLTGYYWWAVLCVDTEDKRYGLNCQVREEAKEFYNGPWNWVDAIFYAIGPCVFMIVLNGLLIKGISDARRLQQEMSNRMELQSKINRQQQITHMILGVTVSFVFLTFPNAIYVIWQTQADMKLVQGDLLLNAKVRLASTIVMTLSACNHAVNFFFYFLTGAKFRAKFVEVFLCSRKGNRNRRPGCYTTYAHRPSHLKTSNVSTCTTST